MLMQHLIHLPLSLLFLCNAGEDLFLKTIVFFILVEICIVTLTFYKHHSYSRPEHQPQTFTV